MKQRFEGVECDGLNCNFELNEWRIKDIYWINDLSSKTDLFDFPSIPFHIPELSWF